MANNVGSIIKNKGGNKMTRKELMKKSPIPWAILLIITLVAGGFLIWPDASDWLSKQRDIKAMEDQNPTLQQKTQTLAVERDNLQNNFNLEAQDYIRIAEQRFPDQINTNLVAQILEMYAILMQMNYRSNTFELTSVAFSSPQNVDGAPYAETNASLNVTIDRTMLEDLMAFLKTSQMTDELRNRVIDGGGGETASLEFLQSNLLPVARISSLAMNENRNNEDGRSGETYNVQLQVLFYSKPL